MLDTSSLPDKAPEYDLEVLLEAGCHFGHQKRKWHPKMSEWIYIEKNGVHIFDLAKTAQQLQLAYNYLYDLGSQGKKVIFVGTKRQARDIIKSEAERVGAMHVTSRWLGGLFTNRKQVGKSLKRMLEIEEGLATDKYKGYTKFERVQLEKEKGRLERFFGGLRPLKDLPDCIFVVDSQRESIAATEARAVGVPVIALIDSNSDPSLIDLPIPANDDGINSVQLVVKEMAKAYEEGKKAQKK